MTDLISMQIADIADAPDPFMTGIRTRARVTGFYRLGQDGLGRPALLPCTPEDDRLSVVGSVAGCGLFHRPWQLAWRGVVNWDDAILETERAHWAETVKNDDDTLLREWARDPRMLAKFGPMSAHERLLFVAWRHETDARIRADTVEDA